MSRTVCAVLFDFFYPDGSLLQRKFTLTGSNGRSRDVTCNPFYFWIFIYNVIGRIYV